MSRRQIPGEDVLQVIGCEINTRPVAPAIEDLAPFVVGVSRTTNGSLAVRFAPEARERVEAFAAAERVCCAAIDWQVDAGPPVTLRIGAEELVLDAIAMMFPTIK